MRAEAARPPGPELSLGPALEHLDYVERDAAGREIDREAGWLSGMELRIAWTGERAFLRLGGGSYGATVGYAGVTQSANALLDELPIRSRSAAGLFGAGGEAGWRIPVFTSIALFAGASVHGWDRRIQPTTVRSRTGVRYPVQGLHERYTWVEPYGGLEIGWSGPGVVSVDARAELRPTTAARVVVDYGGRTVELALPPRVGFRLELDGEVALGPHGFARATASWQRRAFGASQPDPDLGILEPRSGTELWRLALLLGTRL